MNQMRGPRQTELQGIIKVGGVAELVEGGGLEKLNRVRYLIEKSTKSLCQP
jgi:hypothetical protein